MLYKVLCGIVSVRAILSLSLYLSIFLSISISLCVFYLEWLITYHNQLQCFSTPPSTPSRIVYNNSTNFFFQTCVLEMMMIMMIMIIMPCKYLSSWVTEGRRRERKKTEGKGREGKHLNNSKEHWSWTVLCNDNNCSAFFKHSEAV